MKIPFYAPTCQAMSSPNKVLINNILTQIELKKAKRKNLKHDNC